MMKKLWLGLVGVAVLVAPLLAVWPARAAATPLVAGDIAIIGYNYDDPDAFAFVLLRNVGSGTSLTFTDNGWRSTGVFRTGEGSFTWTAATDLPAGTVVRPTVSSVAFSVSGDQILAHQGTSGSPTFIYALNSEAIGWQADSTTSNDSALPTGLVNGTSAVAIDEIDNAIYAGPTSGTRAQLLAAISNKANWTVNDTIRFTMPSAAFTVTDANPPTSTPTRTPTRTPTATNTATPTATFTPAAPACPAGTITGISNIQGSGSSSPMLNSAVTIRGRVVGDFQGTGSFSGFFVQDGGDGNSATSDAIFVASTLAVNPGNSVQVSGSVNETGSLTQLGSVTAVTVCGSAPTINPVALSLPMASSSDWEKYEGMLVSFNQTLYVSGNYTLGRYGEINLASEVLKQPTHITTPGSAANAVAAQNLLKQILLDDGLSTQNPDPIKYPSPSLSAANTLRVGDSVTGLTGVLDYRFNLYRIQPTGAVNFAFTGARNTTSPSVSGGLRVASFNVLNYFNGPTFPTSRGASTSTEFTRQRNKIISAILQMNADIIGLMEIENDGYGTSSAIQDLVNGLNAAAPAGTTYAFINPGGTALGSDEIAVGLIYRTQTVAPVGAATTKSNGAFASLNRQPLVQTFRQLSNNAKLTVAVNHFKSKGSACTGDPDLGDGQGNCNLTRVQAASELVSWLATDPTGSGDADFIIIGDLNAYAQENPVTTIKNAGYTDVVWAHLGAAAYSYNFDAQNGYLDHALATASLAAQVAGVAEWHINSPEPISLDYNTEFKSAGQVTSLYAADPYRASDHDPVVVGLNLTP